MWSALAILGGDFRAKKRKKEKLYNKVIKTMIKKC